MNQDSCKFRRNNSPDTTNLEEINWDVTRHTSTNNGSSKMEEMDKVQQQQCGYACVHACMHAPHWVFGFVATPGQPSDPSTVELHFFSPSPEPQNLWGTVPACHWREMRASAWLCGKTRKDSPPK